VIGASWGGALRDQLKAFFGDPRRLHESTLERTDRRTEGREAPLGVPDGLNLRTMPFEQQQASIAASEQPCWLEVDVELTLAANGTVVAATVVRPSGRRSFDRYALSEVRRVAALRPTPLPRAALVTYRLRASYVAKIPRAFSFRFDETGTGNPRARGASRFVLVDNPVEEIRSEVVLLAIVERLAMN
jgi:TonB family protein